MEGVGMDQEEGEDGRICICPPYWQVEAEKILVRFEIEHETTWIQSKE